MVQRMLAAVYPESQIMPNGYYGKYTAHYLNNFKEEVGMD